MGKRPLSTLEFTNYVLQIKYLSQIQGQQFIILQKSRFLLVFVETRARKAFHWFVFFLLGMNVGNIQLMCSSCTYSL
jgi:hypothetical protein